MLNTYLQLAYTFFNALIFVSFSHNPADTAQNSLIFICLYIPYTMCPNNWIPFHFQNEYVGIHRCVTNPLILTPQLRAPVQDKPRDSVSRGNTPITSHANSYRNKLHDLIFHCDKLRLKSFALIV
jgi:hypothetical protein